MFGIIGTIVTMLIITTSALANIYDAGKYSDANAKIKLRMPKEVRNTAILSFIINAIVIMLFALAW
jgi:hypothetical protein